MRKRQQLHLPTLDPAPLMVLPAHVLQAEKPRLDLPEAEMEAVLRALDPDRVGYGLNRSARRIAASVCKAAPATLSVKQRNAAIRIAWRFRRQLPIPVRITLARWKPETLR